MKQLVKPYLCESVNDQKYFSVNPKYSKIFKDVGIISDTPFFKTNPYKDGLHFNDAEDSPHFQYFDHLDENKFSVKKSNLPLLMGSIANTESVEIYFESLNLNIESILDSINDSNDWAKTNYKEVYLKHLSDSIVKYKNEQFLTNEK